MTEEPKLADHYEPKPTVMCPICGSALRQWKGGEGPCRGLLWREFVAEPSLELLPDLADGQKAELTALRLTELVHIATTCAHCHDGNLHVQARCVVVDDVWSDTEITEVKNTVTGKLFYSKYD